MTVQQLADALGAELWPGEGDGSMQVNAVNSWGRAGDGDIVFAEDDSAAAEAARGGATAILVASRFNCPKPLLVTRNPRLAFARAARLLRGDGAAETSVHPTAILGDGVVVGRNVRIGAGCVLGDGVRVGDGCVLHPRVTVYPGVTLGCRVVVHAGAVLGADGFGYVRDPASGEYTQFPQQGSLVIEDDVEIGANTTIDRGALEETRIGAGTKIDNLVHIGHNVRIGRNVVIAAQTGISGSCTIGDGAVLGGQVGMGDHVTIGAGVILGGGAGILPHKKIEGPGELFWGKPARPVKQILREQATLARLARTATARPVPEKD